MNEQMLRDTTSRLYLSVLRFGRLLDLGAPDNVLAREIVLMTERVGDLILELPDEVEKVVAERDARERLDEGP